MLCAICQKRKAKRHCPGVHGEICALCCGTERENSVTCPLDCVYLQEAHRYEWERRGEKPLAEIPHEKYELDDNFLYHHGVLVEKLGATLLQRALELPATQDSDVREALDALIRTRETLASGIYYDTVPSAPVPEAIYRELQKNLEEQSKEQHIKEDDVIRALVFLVRIAAARDNGRARCRAFLGFLQAAFPAVRPETTSSGLIIAP